MIGREELNGLPVGTIHEARIGQGAFIGVRELSAAEVLQWRAGILEGASPDKVAASLFILCAVGEDGQRLYGPDEAGEVARLPARVVNTVFEVAQEVNGLVLDVEDVLGKSNGSPG